jgi:hypothetical protein
MFWTQDAVFDEEVGRTLNRTTEEDFNRRTGAPV